MPSMSEDKIEFEWGATRGKGGAKKDVQFYESFKYDGSNYSLYDSVYLSKDGAAEPYIGKIIKIWEPANKSKKVKILWFFRPSEISSYIGGLRTLENELFLGTGAGMGLENINSLEAIAGKCNVICISKDKRNRPPSPEELSLADFVFYRTFDVDNFTISDQLGECISNVKVELLLNKENPEIFNPLRIESNDKGHGGNAVATPEIEMDLQKRDHGAKGERPVLNKENPEIFNPLRIESNDKGHGGNAVATPEIEMDLQKRDHGAKGERPVNDFLDDRPHKKLKSAEAFGIRAKSNAPPKLISKKDTRPYGQVSLVTRRPDADNSKWFTGLPWKDSMKAAQEEGTLVLLQNLDLTYTSSEIEDIVWHSFSENCTAKVLNCASSPHSTGQAYVIFKTQQAAVNVVRKLEEGCLMLPNGRPLIGHIAPGQLPRKSSSFPGHLLIDKLKFSTQKDKRDAISTSHSSQPNTLEYDMAMEWRLLQERFELMQKKLLKKQREEMIPLKGNLKRKF